MQKITNIFLVIMAASITLSIVIVFKMVYFNKENEPMFHMHSPKDLLSLFPTSTKEIEQLTNSSINLAQKDIDAIIAIPEDQRTFANTFKALDNFVSLSNFAIASNIIQILEMVHPEKAIRDAAHAAIIKMQDFYIDNLANNRKLFQSLKSYTEHRQQSESLSDIEKYYITETMDAFKRAGLDLPDDKLQEVKALKKEIAALALDFSTNIAQENRTISVERKELAGLDDDFINALKKTDDGLYMLGTDYPTFFNVIQNCTVEQTRKKLFTLFNNRAYPVNEPVLQSILAKRDTLAKKLGFASYADLDLDDQMVKKVQTAQQFISELATKSASKSQQEFTELMKNLPQRISLTQDRKIKPWDYEYIKNQYKKKHLDINENVIAEYFPMEKTVQGLLDIYQQFFSLRFTEEQISNAWHQDVTLITVYDAKTDQLLGYLLLDLYPRENKYSHACQATIIPTTYDEQGNANVGAAVVIANFPQSTETKPSLLKREDVTTFFHEFGHALHALLGRTPLASFSGTNVKRDFVEMPSQMLEEWLWSADILKQVTHHYQTGKSLPDDLIKRILAVKNFDSGNMVQRQLMFASLSLAYHLEGAQKNLYKIYKDLNAAMRPQLAFDAEDHRYASFGHLTEYAAKYYGYMWSKVFALDLFEEIKKHGLLNPEIGSKYVHDVIGQGGSKDPQVLLKDFLGRAPNQNAFLRDLGLNI